MTTIVFVLDFNTACADFERNEMSEIILSIMREKVLFTPKQITHFFGLKNPYDVAYKLRQKGYRIQTTTVGYKLAV